MEGAHPSYERDIFMSGTACHRRTAAAQSAASKAVAHAPPEALRTTLLASVHHPHHVPPLWQTPNGRLQVGVGEGDTMAGAKEVGAVERSGRKGFTKVKQQLAPA